MDGAAAPCATYRADTQAGKAAASDQMQLLRRCTTQGPNSFTSVWCERRDSNPHGLPRQNLNLVRLPIPPYPRS